MAIAMIQTGLLVPHKTKPLQVQLSAQQLTLTLQHFSHTLMQIVKATKPARFNRTLTFCPQEHLVKMTAKQIRLKSIYSIIAISKLAS